MVEDILSRNKPPANVPKIPQTIVTPPNNKSALLCQKKKAPSKKNISTKD